MITKECNDMVFKAGMNILNSENEWDYESQKDALNTLKSWINPSLITEGSRVSVVWDDGGQWVDLDYDVKDGNVMNSCLCFAELYEDGIPNTETWMDAKNVAQILSKEYNLPIVICA